MSVLRNFFAIFGLVSFILLIVAGVKTFTVFNKIDTFDEAAVDIYMQFVKTIYETGSTIDALVYKVPVKAGLNAEDVDKSIVSIANELNIKNVGELTLSRQVEAISGKPYRFIKIYLLCDAMTAASILNYNDAYASILPCRISLVEDETGKLWIYTLDLNLLIHGGKPIPPALKAEALKVRDTLTQIMKRAANDEF